MKAAAIDIGTNSCRLLIAEKTSEQSFDILVRKLKITRLGEGVDQNKKLKKAAVKRVIRTLKDYKKIIEENQLEKIRIVGTSALRDVKNYAVLANEINELGFELEIISGEKEAELNYLGAASNLNTDFLLIDIGGGSTEFIWSAVSDISFISLDIGCVRMTERFISNPDKEIKEAEINKIKHYVKKFLSANLDLNKTFKLKGVGGTITTLAAVKIGLEIYDSSKIENLKINIIELEEIIKKLNKINLNQRKMVKGLQPKRADIIVAGLVILKTIMEYIGSKELYVSDHDLLYGLLKKELFN